MLAVRFLGEIQELVAHEFCVWATRTTARNYPKELILNNL